MTCITEYDQERALAEQREDARNEGIEIGVKKGRDEGKLETLTSLVEDGILSVIEAARRAGMPLAEFEVKTGLKAGSATS